MYLYKYIYAYLCKYICMYDIYARIYVLIYLFTIYHFLFYRLPTDTALLLSSSSFVVFSRVHFIASVFPLAVPPSIFAEKIKGFLLNSSLYIFCNCFLASANFINDESRLYNGHRHSTTISRTPHLQRPRIRKLSKHSALHRQRFFSRISLLRHFRTQLQR